MPIVLKSGSLNLLEPSGPVQACNGIALPLPLTTQLCEDDLNRLTKCSLAVFIKKITWVFNIDYSFLKSKHNFSIYGIVETERKATDYSNMCILLGGLPFF
jgi:hypothetical protein